MSNEETIHFSPEKEGAHITVRSTGGFVTTFWVAEIYLRAIIAAIESVKESSEKDRESKK